MCYSKNLSLASLSFGIFNSIILMYFGNKQSAETNRVIGYLFIFVALMQLVEYFLWIDINCDKGYNKIGSLVGPILNHLQPVIMLALATLFLKSADIIPMNVIIIVNTLYLFYVFQQYYIYVNNPSNLCVKTNDCNHLDWTWKKDFNYSLYFMITLINIANFYTNTNLMVSMGLSYLLLIISILNFNKNIGEFWCLMVTGIPLVNLLMQNVLNINN
ncbi:hypothetical protein Indivirus_1_137 [Indivirus ILV1]|uniref:Uncharacterized protein n=1 Tax=Indivirus ILV1 TaxID=1977633 RepID=A0A1V0SD10_9VIRU|nr:hypothetical protein Indivirus_1_137 [Indivirus ILV1]